MVGVPEPFQNCKTRTLNTFDIWTNDFPASIRLGFQATQRHHGHHVFTVLFSPLDLMVITSTVTEVDGSVVVVCCSILSSVKWEFGFGVCTWSVSGVKYKYIRRVGLLIVSKENHAWAISSFCTSSKRYKNGGLYHAVSRVASSQQASFQHALRKGLNKLDELDQANNL